MADDDRAVMDRLAALEAEVKADADAKQARRAAAVSKLRAQRVTQAAADDAQVRRVEPISKKRSSVPSIAPSTRPSTNPVRFTSRDRDDHADPLEGLGGALELASKANKVKQELQRAPRKGDKSWIKSGVASLALGPIGWLYAGSLREAVPASVGWVGLALLASKILPVFLMMPVLMVVLPLSAIAGVVYALQYNRSGRRQRLFDRDKDKKQLRSGAEND